MSSTSRYTESSVAGRDALVALDWIGRQVAWERRLEHLEQREARAAVDAILLEIESAVRSPVRAIEAAAILGEVGPHAGSARGAARGLL